MLAAITEASKHACVCGCEGTIDSHCNGGGDVDGGAAGDEGVIHPIGEEDVGRLPHRRQPKAARKKHMSS